MSKQQIELDLVASTREDWDNEEQEFLDVTKEVPEPATLDALSYDEFIRTQIADASSHRSTYLDFYCTYPS